MPEQTKSMAGRVAGGSTAIPSQTPVTVVTGSAAILDPLGKKVVRTQSFRGMLVKDPLGDGQDVVGGYFLISAESYDDAVALAATCPHLDFGRIEVRRIEPTM